MKKLLSALTLGLMLVILPTITLAAEFRESQTGSVELNSGENAKNLYAVGNIVNISGNTKSDLVTAGNTLNLNGSVSGGLFAAGSNVNLVGSVGQNARIAGSNININSSIQEDLLVAGASVIISPEATIHGDLLAGVGTLTINGPVGGNLKISGGDVTINSKIGGDVVIYGGKVKLGDKANIAGKLTYSSTEEAQISTSAIVTGATDYKKIETKSFDSSKFNAAMGVFGFIGLLMGMVVLFFFVYVLPKTSLTLVKSSMLSIWSNFAWGLLTFVVAPSALIILAISVVGIGLAGAILMFYVVTLKIAFISGTLAIGSQIVKWIEKKEYRADWLSVLAGTLAVVILHLIPFLGTLAIWLVGLAVLGQLVKNIGAFIKSQR